MPAPDDPPTTASPSGTTSTRSSGSTTAPASTERTAEAALPLPMPDDPLVAAQVTASGTSVTRAATTPEPDVVRQTAPLVVPRAPVTTTPRAARTGRTTPRATTKPTPKPKSHRRAAAPAPAKPVASRPAVPRDAVRLGLPAAVLAVRPSDAGLNRALLGAAALLLAFAACGSLLFGIAARHSTRHA